MAKSVCTSTTSECCTQLLANSRKASESLQDPTTTQAPTTTAAPSTSNSGVDASTASSSASPTASSSAINATSGSSSTPSPTALGIAAGVCIFLIVSLLVGSAFLVRHYANKKKVSQGPPGNKSRFSVASFMSGKSFNSKAYPSNPRPPTPDSFTSFHNRALSADALYNNVERPESQVVGIDVGRESSLFDPFTYARESMMSGSPSLPPPPKSLPPPRSELDF